MTQMAIICNGSESSSFMPTLIVGSSGIAVGNEVSIFITPGGSQAFLKGELEKVGTPKGLPNPVELFNTILDEGGKIIALGTPEDVAKTKKSYTGQYLKEILKGKNF